MAPIDLCSPDTQLSISPDSYFVNLDDGIVILDLKQEQYFGLEDVGMRVWQLIQQGNNLGEIHQSLGEEYDVPSESLWVDLCALVQDLLKQGLVR